MPATFTVNGTLSAWSGTPPGLIGPEAGITTPTSAIGDRPYSPGDGNYARALDATDADAIANLTGAVTGRGLFQDITAFIAALSASYGAQTVGGVAQSAANGHLNAVLAPRALMCAVRDQINFMLMNSPVPR
jgi:hypothetical protein